MNADTIYSRLIEITPEFAVSWASATNYNRNDDGTFTKCGVFAEFSTFVRDNYESLTESQLASIGRFVSDCMSNSDAEVDIAAASCFLENLASERFSIDFQRFLKSNALQFFREWPGA